MSFLDILGNFSWGAHSIALTVGCVACLRLWKRGADKAFAAAAWLGLAGVALMSLPVLAGWIMYYLPVDPSWWMLTTYTANISAILLFGHFVACAAGAFRTASRLASRPGVEVREEKAAE